VVSSPASDSAMTTHSQHEAAGASASTEIPDEFNPRHIVRRLVELALLGVVVAVAISALPGLGDLRHRFGQADAAFVVLAAVLKLASCLCNILAFRYVFCRRLGWGFSYRLGMAEQAANVLLPTGGAGGLALGAWALRRGGLSSEYVARRSVAFFVITSTPNFLCAAIVGPSLLLGVLSGHAPVVPTAVFSALAIGAIGFAVLLPSIVDRIRPREPHSRPGRVINSALTSLGDGIRDTGALLRPAHVWVIVGAIGYLAFDIAAFAAAFAAFGTVPPVGPLVFGYTIGQLGGLIPLPGGIGGTDGGLIGAMVLYGAPLSLTAAAVVAYRAFQLGIPAILGAIAFVQLRRTLRASDQPTNLCAPLADPIPIRVRIPDQVVR
jgi:uncharacterized membrane protein YbhN (UPF0104 family)